MPRFDLNLLSALEALLGECNVTRAAERLHVTQPTMSGMLQRLRYQFDDPLLTRVGRKMELTPFATALVAPVRDALKSIETLVNSGPVFDPATSTRTFSIMVSDYCTMIFMPHVIARLAQRAPGLRLEMHALHAPIERLLSGEIDLCVSTDDRSLFNCVRGDTILQGDPLFSDEFVCVVARDHPLDGVVTLSDYMRYPHVGVQMAGRMDTIDTLSLQQCVPDYRPGYVVADFSLVPAMIANSSAIGIIQKRLAGIAAKTLPIRTFAPPFAIPNINETMLWHPRHSDDPAHGWLRELMADEAANMFDDAVALTQMEMLAGLGRLNRVERQSLQSAMN